MTAAFALHLHGEYRLVWVRCFVGRFAGWLLLNGGWMAAPSCDLGRCCNYEMAVWEREGEDKVIWRRSFWKEMNEVLKKMMRKAVFEGGRGEIFGNIMGSSIKGSLVVLVIFRCV